MKKIFLFVSLLILLSCSSDEYETGTIERKFVLEEIALIGEADIDKVGTMEEVEYKIYNDDSIYSVSDFLNISRVKKSNEFPVDLKDDDENLITPNAIGIYTMFYRHSDLGSLDLELRIYNSNKEAIDFGKKSAEKSISTVALTIGGHVRSEKYLYDAYVLKGNSILLCQKSLTICDEIYKEIDK